MRFTAIKRFCSDFTFPQHLALTFNLTLTHSKGPSSPSLQMHMILHLIFQQILRRRVRPPAGPKQINKTVSQINYNPPDWNKARTEDKESRNQNFWSWKIFLLNTLRVIKTITPLETTRALLFFNVFPAKGKCQNHKMSFRWFIFATVFVSVLRGGGKKKEQAVLWGIKGSWRKSELCSSRNGRIHLCVAKGFNWLTETSGQPPPPPPPPSDSVANIILKEKGGINGPFTSKF